MTDAELPPDPFPPTICRGHASAADGDVIEVAIEAVPLNIDGPDLAEWCDTCLLPSALGYRFRILANGVPLPSTLHLLVCPDCGRTDRRTT